MTTTLGLAKQTDFSANHLAGTSKTNISTTIDNRIYNSRLNTPHQLEPQTKMSSIFTGQKMADTSKDGLLLGRRICHITTIQAEVKKFLHAYVILF